MHYSKESAVIATVLFPSNIDGTSANRLGLLPCTTGSNLGQDIIVNGIHLVSPFAYTRKQYWRVIWLLSKLALIGVLTSYA